MRAMFLVMIVPLAASAQDIPAGPPVREKTVGAGAAATVGSEGYRKVSLFADADWRGEGAQPYAWGDLSATRDSRTLSAGGGLSKALEADPDLRLSGGAGFSVGRFVDGSGGAGSLSLEAGAEKRLEAAAIGADYRFTRGSIGGTDSPGEDRRASERARGRARGGTGAEVYTYHDISAFTRLPLGENRLTLRLGYGKPSYAGSGVVTETASLRVPVKDPLSLTAAVAFEQRRSRPTQAYVSAGVLAFWE